MKPFLLTLLATAAFAQPSEQKALTNYDVVVLAKAGFTEEFILETIATQKSDFDTSAASLAGLVKEGLNEHVLRAMRGAKSDGAAPKSSGMSIHGSEKKTRSEIVKPSPTGLAIATQTPYYESTSFLFGLFHKQIGVGTVPQAEQIVAPPFGTNANSSRRAANFPAIVSPSGSATRYVIIP